MRIFISWSMEESHRIALALRRLFQAVVPGAQSWISSEDIEPGARWSHVLAAELEASSFGIVCLVPANLDSPWVHFEAGAIAKSVAEGRLIPVVRRVTLNDIPGPLRQFQAVLCDEAGIHRLVRILNDRTESPVPDTDLEEAFQRSFPEFLQEIESVSPDIGEAEVSNGQAADLNIRMGFLGAWQDEQIIIENQGDGLAQDIEVFADGRSISEASFVISNQQYVSRLRPGEEFGVKIALSMGDPERTEVRVQWREESGDVRFTEKLVTLI